MTTTGNPFALTGASSLVSPFVSFSGGLQGFLPVFFALLGFIESLVFVYLFSFEQQQAPSLLVYRNSSCAGAG